MFKLSFKIWILANLVIFFIFVISLFPNGFGPGWQAVLFSSLFSLPAIPVIYLFLRVLKRVHGHVIFSWLLLLLATGFMAYASYWLFDHWFGSDWRELNFILPLSLLSGYAAVLFFSPSLHYLFQKFQYENEPECY